jgi:CO/xanthine dehydrogenase FAD-binding subunit
MAAAAVLRMEGRVCRRARVALSHAGGAAELLVALVPRLEGQEPNLSLIKSVAESVRASIQPMADYRASSDYRCELAGVLTRRALEAAWRRASA